MRYFITIIGWLWLSVGFASIEQDAINSADDTARTTLQTIYASVKNNPQLSWCQVLETRLPRIFSKTLLNSLNRELIDKTILLEFYLPSYISAFYDELAKINSQRYNGCPRAVGQCVDVVLIERTLIPFFRSSKSTLRSVASLSEIVNASMSLSHPPRICQSASVCMNQLREAYNYHLGLRLSNKQLENFCQY